MNQLNYQFLDKLKELNFVDRIYLFGSRARGDHTPTSDIDIAISCPSATPNDWFKIINIIDEADTLLKIDYVNLNDADPNLKNIINKEGILLYERKNFK